MTMFYVQLTTFLQTYSFVCCGEKVYLKKNEGNFLWRINSIDIEEIKPPEEPDILSILGVSKQDFPSDFFYATTDCDDPTKPLLSMVTLLFQDVKLNSTSCLKALRERATLLLSLAVAYKETYQDPQFFLGNYADEDIMDMMQDFLGLRVEMIESTGPLSVEEKEEVSCVLEIVN